ncbi:MAG: PA3371 family protein [Pseudomonadota bacterium]
MSKPAFYLLILASLMGLVLLFAPPGAAPNLAKPILGILVGLFVLALALGRRIKFDPVLR